MKRELIANYHTHTKRCHHAVGEDREYIESAIKAGIKFLGFSDHVAWPYESGYVSPTRMRLDEMGGYINDIRRLADEYKDQITIYCGFEAEYFPSMFEKFKKNMSQYDYDYLILGPHFPGTEELGVYYGNPFNNTDYLKMYVEHNIEAMDTGYYIYLAHPDIGNFTGDQELYTRGLRKLCAAAKAHNMPIEFNLLGFRRKSHYPSIRLLEIAKELGNDMIIGVDAHDPKHFSDPKVYSDAYELIDKYGINIIDKLDIKRH